MPPLPWTTSAEVAPDTPCTVLATRLPLRSFRAVPPFLRWTLRIRRQLAASPGLVGYALNAELPSKTFWTVSAWTNDDDMARFAAAAPHHEAVAAMRPFMAKPSFLRWTCTAGDLPIGWAEVRRRADEASARRRRDVAGDAVPITEHSLVLMAMHSAMRADSRRLVHAVTDLDDGDREHAAALGRAFSAVTELIHDHHWTEDDVIYPFLLDTVPTFERDAVLLEDDHVALDAAMARVNARFRLLAHGVSPTVWSATRDGLLDDATAFRDVLGGHLEREEAVVIPAFESVLSEAERRTLRRQESKFTTYRHMRMAVPWVLANATPEEGDRLRATAPRLLNTVQDHVWDRQFRHAMAPLYTSSP